MDTHSSTWYTLATLIFILASSIDVATARPLHHKSAPKVSKSKNNHFIKTTCGGTAFPSLCLASLSPYSDKVQSSPAQLAEAALIVSLAKAQSASDEVTKLSVTGGMNETEAGAVSDCMMTMADAVAMLQRSLDAVRQIGAGKNVRVRMWNCQTWVSTALTDVNACMSSGIRDSVRVDLVTAVQLASNALSLVNGLASSVLSKFHKH